jgi:hypothetical protein
MGPGGADSQPIRSEIGKNQMFLVCQLNDACTLCGSAISRLLAAARCPTVSPVGSPAARLRAPAHSTAHGTSPGSPGLGRTRHAPAAAAPAAACSLVPNCTRRGEQPPDHPYSYDVETTPMPMRIQRKSDVFNCLYLTKNRGYSLRYSTQSNESCEDLVIG